MARNFAQLLTGALPADELARLQSVADEAADLKMSLYMVGGLPRDLVLGRVSSDYDLVVEGDAIQLARKLARAFGGKVTAHPKFGTAKWTSDKTRHAHGDGTIAPSPSLAPIHVDLVSARRESYPRPGALPEVQRGNILDDLRRRDFSINTLAIRLDGDHFGEVLDEFNALNDISDGSIRVLHAESFRDDPTRMYRAVRYEQRLGFTISSDTVALMPAAREMVRRLSAHRLRRELELILDEERRSLMVRRLARLDLLSPISPLLPATEVAFQRLAVDDRPSDLANVLPSRPLLGWLLWLIELMPAKLRALDKRLHFTREVSNSLPAAHQIWRQQSTLSRWRRSRITAYLHRMPVPAVCAVIVGTESDTVRDVLREYLLEWRHVRPSISGHDLKAMGVTPGPIYERILTDLRAAWLDGSVTNKDQERKLLARVLEHHVHHRTGAKRKPPR